MEMKKTLQDSELLSNQPCHIPGYTGVTKDLINKFGGTFGRLTHECLVERPPHVRVLFDGVPGLEERAKKNEAVKTREVRGDVIFSDTMVPGYTGNVPYLSETHGRTYREACNDAIANFEQQQKQIDWKHVTPENTSYRLPRLKQVAPSAEPFYSKDLCHPPLSPYYMPPNHPNRRFMPGYTGFVPQSRFIDGSVYSTTTSRALNEFDRLQGTNAFNLGRNVDPHETVPKPKRDPNVYLPHVGMNPRYTGHVPGLKESIGKTYGNSTRNALATLGIQV